MCCCRRLPLRRFPQSKCRLMAGMPASCPWYTVHSTCTRHSHNPARSTSSSCSPSYQASLASQVRPTTSREARTMTPWHIGGKPTGCLVSQSALACSTVPSACRRCRSSIMQSRPPRRRPLPRPRRYERFRPLSVMQWNRKSC